MRYASLSPDYGATRLHPGYEASPVARMERSAMRGNYHGIRGGSI
jgi:hypothetical protein